MHMHPAGLGDSDLTGAKHEFHYSDQLMRQQFRFARQGQSRSSRLLAERWPECKYTLCRFASNAVVMTRAAGSDELQQRLVGVDLSVLLCRPCDSEPIGPLAESASLR
jgi:hypothetical protein